jgi:hypothetical protein
MDLQDVDVTLDLRKLGLRHGTPTRAHPKCGCGGEHPAHVEIDLDEEDLVRASEVPVIMGIEDALQRLHELAHPDGTLLIASCREPECTEVVLAYGLSLQLSINLDILGP